MLHIHFGAGRLGLGLVCPFLHTGESELFILNRAVSASKATGSTALEPGRRNQLLAGNPLKEYIIDTPGSGMEERERVLYEGFFTYGDSDVESHIDRILLESRQAANGVLFTASLLAIDHYAPVVEVLNRLCRARETHQGTIGDIYLIACENTVSAEEVFEHPQTARLLSADARRHVRCVPALVDRVCTNMVEDVVDGEPVVIVHAEEYGSLKLAPTEHTSGLPELLRGSRVEFSRHLEVEKEIKGWLLNGSHWLIALTAFQETGGDPNVKLNDFIKGSENHALYAAEVVNEMRDGVEALLLSDPQYAGFVKDVNVSAYLDGAASSILARFESSQDTITRILARFRAPSHNELTTVQSFINRFLGRVEQPLVAYQAAKGTPARSATQGIFNLFRLQASGTYIDTPAAA